MKTADADKEETMKKRWIGVALAGCMCLSGMGLTACGGGKTVSVPYDDMVSEEGDYDQKLFYRNDCEVYAPDSQVIKITDTESEEYGYYYMYATNSLTVYRSKDLNNWENVSMLKGFNAYYPAANDFGDGRATSWWAPEVIFDEESKTYYLYFSMEPRNGQPDDVTDETIICAKSENPYGPFVNVRTAPVSNPQYNGNPETEGEDVYWQNKLLYGKENYFFDMAKLAPVLREKYPERFGEGYRYVSALDPHPFVDPAVDPETGKHKKYLYWVSEMRYTLEESTCTFVMEMEDWETPIYETATRLTKPRYTTVEGDVLCDGETVENNINEGPYVYPKKQADGSYQYYLTLSANSWDSKTYCVLQAVGDSPMGPFTKLQQSQGGVLIGTDNSLWDHISGPGHHSFVEEDGEVYILYHQHMNVVEAGVNRAVSLDEIKFTKNGDGQEVMYANGPTRTSVQNLPSFISGYKNIAPEATVTASNKADATVLNDGLVSLYTYIDYVKEFTSEKEVTFTLEFADYREITAIMVYNSKHYEEVFESVAKIRIHFKDGEEEYVGEMRDVLFDMEANSLPSQYAMRPGGAAIAVFAPASVKKIEITVKVPEKRIIDQDDDGRYIYQDKVSLSEIKVLGK